MGEHEVSPILSLKIPLGTGCHFWRKAVSVSGEVGCGLPLHVIDLIKPEQNQRGCQHYNPVSFLGLPP